MGSQGQRGADSRRRPANQTGSGRVQGLFILADPRTRSGRDNRHVRKVRPPLPRTCSVHHEGTKATKDSSARSTSSHAASEWRGGRGLQERRGVAREVAAAALPATTWAYPKRPCFGLRLLRFAQDDSARAGDAGTATAWNPRRAALFHRCGRPRQVTSATSRHQLWSWRRPKFSSTAAPASRSRSPGSRYRRNESSSSSSVTSERQSP